MNVHLRCWPRALWGLVVLFCCSCATTGDLEKVQRNHLALGGRVDAMKTKQTRLALQLRSIDKKIVRLSSIFNQFRKQGRYSFANIGSKLDELQIKHQEILGKFQLLKLAFEKLNKQITQPGGAAGSSQVLTPEATYNLANKMFVAKNYDQAIMHLKNLIKQNPTHASTDNAYMLIGDSYSEKGNAYEAIIWYNDVRKKFSTGDQVDHALLKLGVAHYKIGACPEGRAFLRRMLRKYRSSKHTTRARDLFKNWRKHCKKS